MGEIEIKALESDMEQFINRLRKNVTREEAVKNLIKIGVLEQDGKTITEHQRIIC